MSVEEALAIVREEIVPDTTPVFRKRYRDAAIVLADEVERLRQENESE